MFYRHKTLNSKRNGLIEVERFKYLLLFSDPRLRRQVLGQGLRHWRCLQGKSIFIRLYPDDAPLPAAVQPTSHSCPAG